MRMALGAYPHEVLCLILRQGLQIVALGSLLGVLTALAVTRFMTSLLFGVTATDPITFAGVVILLILIALAACYVPARRATRVDPLVALRYE